jgi:Phosphotransferase enzyme family
VTSGTAAVPLTIDEVTPQWLTAILRTDDTLPDDATVTDLRAEQIAMDSGFSSLLYRLHLSGGGVPESDVAKLPALSEAGDATKMLGGYAREVAFYRHFAGRAPIGTPHVYTARMAENNADFVLVLKACTAGTTPTISRVCRSNAPAAIGQLAGLHAWSTDAANAKALGEFPRLDTPMMRDLLSAAFEPAWGIYLDKADVPVPPAVAQYAERFAELAPVAMEALSKPSMLIHGDIRADNMFFSGAEMKVVDIQLAAVDSGATDIGYLVSQGLPTDIRSVATKSCCVNTLRCSQNVAAVITRSTKPGGITVSLSHISSFCP